MSTRAERRLREAQDALAEATSVHQAAAEAAQALEDRAVNGEAVEPLDLAAAQGDAGVKAKRVQRAQAAVDAEQATVDEERARARHRELVEAAQAARADLDTSGILTTVEDLFRRAFAASDAHAEVKARVRAEHGELPRGGTHGVDPMLQVFKLDGERYESPDQYRVVRNLKDAVQRVFDEIVAERQRARWEARPMPTDWRQRAIDAGLEKVREDAARYKPSPDLPAA